MDPYYSSPRATIYHANCIHAMRCFSPNSIDTIIADPPYGLKFMGKWWDHGVPGIPFWRGALRVAKPGAMLMAFGGTRTHHRLMCAIEDAGWKIRDVVMWVYGSGLPKGCNISKAIDKAAGAERKVIGRYQPPGMDRPWNLRNANDERGVDIFASSRNNLDITAPATDAARLWDGWNTTLKPSWEPIVLAMKPLDGTFAQNALKWGVAGLWIDGCRIEYQSGADRASATPRGECTSKGISAIGAEPDAGRGLDRVEFERPEQKGRWPANLIHDGGDEVLSCFPDSPGQIAQARNDGSPQGNQVFGKMNHITHHPEPRSDDDKSAARFFYCSKASKSERTCSGQVVNCHATVKPISLLRYLCRLTRTPTDGIVLDPFMGSGSTLLAALHEGRNVIGIDIEEESCEIARQRLEATFGVG